MKGIFISFEGIEGTGKSSQAKKLSEYLKARELDVILTVEPGGTRIGQKIRDLLLATEHTEMLPVTELLLYFASRTQHIEEVIIPALRREAIVITDRFTDSTIAYQGYGRGIDLKLIDEIDLISTGRLRPDITILLDLDAETGLKRNRGINKNDRLEQEDIAFHQRVRNGFHQLAAKDPGRIKLIDASGSIEDIYGNIVSIIKDFLQYHGI